MTLSLCFTAIVSMASTLHGNPKTWTAMIALVAGVIAASILEASMQNVSGSISTNIGVQRSHKIAVVVATYEKGVVIISPSVISSARSASCSAIVPLPTT